MPTLLDDTLERLRNAPRWLSLSQIAQESGLKVAWLSALASGAIEDPGVKKVQQLHDYLRVVPTDRKPEVLPFDRIKDIPANCAGNLPIRAVYVFYSGELCLYIGSSDNLGRRLREHGRNKDLIGYEPTHVVLTYFAEEAKAQMLALEAAKVRALKPVLNVRYAKDAAE